MKTDYRIRAVQMDLARQMETLDTIRSFIDFIAGSGYNTLHLYLEGRIRTETFPCPSERESYSLDDMRAIVDYADKLGIEVIPQVNCFSHAELFLRHPALQSIGELRDSKSTGRFGGTAPGSTFCPSVEATYTFLEAYLTEVAAVFPSKWFHVGLDEVWDIGRCPACRQRLRDGETQDDLFHQHLLCLHQIVSGKLGKRMMMWDDMLDEYTTILERLPTDIVACVWQYGNMTDRCKTHFGNQKYDWRLAEYTRRGIDFLICPVNWNPLNVESLTRHAAAYQPLGGLLTTWEYAASFPLWQYPIIAFTGMLWECGQWWRGRDMFAMVCENLFGHEADEVTAAIWALLCHGQGARLSASALPLRGPITHSEEEAVATLSLIRKRLAAATPSHTLGKEVLRDLLINVDSQLTAHAWRAVTEDAGLLGAGQPAPPVADLLVKAQAVLTQVRDLKVRRADQWEQLRPGLLPRGGQPLLSAEETGIAAFVDRLERNEEKAGLLRIRYALPDFFGSQKVRVLVRSATDATWNKVHEGTPKPREAIFDDRPFYVFEHPLSGGLIPDQVRIESWGYGGVGILYVEYLAGAEVLVPGAIVVEEGCVIHSEAVLHDDNFWCQIGETDAHAAFHCPELAEAIHRLELTLIPLT